MSVYGSRAAYFKFGVDPQEEMLKAGKRPGDPGWGREPREQWGTLVRDEATTPLETEPGAYEDFYAGVERALREHVPPPVDALEAIAGLEVLEAALASARTGTVVATAAG